MNARAAARRPGPPPGGPGQRPAAGAGARLIPDAGHGGPDRVGDLVVLARARWPEGPDDTLPPIPGFVGSSFSPLVAEAARRCLRAFFGEPPADPGRGERVAVVVVSRTGDLGTATAVARAVDERRRVPPLLFFQSNHNAVAGFIASRWGLGGPVLCTICDGDAVADARSSAALLVEDGDADAALIVVADQARPGAGRDQAVALLAGPASWRPGAARPGIRTNG